MQLLPELSPRTLPIPPGAFTSQLDPKAQPVLPITQATAVYFRQPPSCQSKSSGNANMLSAKAGQFISAEAQHGD